MLMKKILLLPVLVFACIYLAGAEKNGKLPQITCVTNKNALAYQPGGEMIFTFRLDTGRLKAGKYFLAFTRNGDDLKKFSGKAPADKPLVVRTSLDRPGFVKVDVFLVDEKGRRVSFRENIRWYNRKGNIAFFAGAAVQPEKLRDCGEPADFDAFWVRQKKRLAGVPFAGKVEMKTVKTTPAGKVYAVVIPAPGPRPATGYMTIPANAKKGSLPIQINFFGHGNTIQKPPRSVPAGRISFWLNAHGQKLGESPAYYKAFFKSICDSKGKYAFDPVENRDPESCFFNGMVMRVLRSLEFLKTLPEWDRKHITASGNSQGGLQAMWAGALDKDVTAVFHGITWCCDIAGAVKNKRLGSEKRPQYVPGLDYFDPVFMAKRIKNAKVTITRAGLGDYTSPPSGIAVCYNNLATPDKSITWVQGSDHGFVPEKSEVTVWKNR